MSTYQNEPTPATQPTRTVPPPETQTHDEPPTDERALREEIRHTREDLGATVDELSERMVVQSQRALAPLAVAGALIITTAITVSAVRKRRDSSRVRSRAAARRRHRRRR